MKKLNENVKHAHHYVFRAYQKHWAIENDDKRVWVCRNKMLPVKPVGIGTNLVKNDLYKLQELKDVDKAFLDKWLKYGLTNKAVLEEIDKHIAYTQVFFSDKEYLQRLRDFFDSSNDDKTSNSMQETFLELHNVIERGIYNTEEDFHCEYEIEGIEYIRKMISEESIISKKEKENFIVFLSLQLFRTKKVYDILKNFIGNNRIGLSQATGIDLSTLNAKAIIPHMIWFDEMRLAEGLIGRNAHMTLLVNKTSIPFITSDQPVINIRENREKELVLFYPLSPLYAVTVNDTNRNDKIVYERGENTHILKYNALIAKESENVLISNKREVLEAIVEGE